jgi:hypothetical protein
LLSLVYVAILAKPHNTPVRIGRGFSFRPKLNLLSLGDYTNLKPIRHRGAAEMKLILVLSAFFFSSSVFALNPPKDYGIKLVPTFMAEKVVADCEYLGEVSSRSAWGGLVAGSLGKKGVMKRMYKKANKLGATHMVLVEASSTAWSGFTAGSAHAFDCGGSSMASAGYSAKEAAELKQSQKQAEISATDSEVPSLRAVKGEAAESCTFLKSIMKGAGGSGDPSTYLELALEKALREAHQLGADSYSVVNMDTTESGASIVIDALKCT